MKTIDLLLRDEGKSLIADDIFLLLGNFGKVRILYESKKERDIQSVKDKIMRYVENAFYKYKPKSLKINQSFYQFKQKLNNSKIIFV